MPSGRPPITAYLDEATFDGFRSFCVRYGVSAAAMVEAFARACIAADGGDKFLLPELPGWLVEIVTEGRQVAGERRARD